MGWDAFGWVTAGSCLGFLLRRWADAYEDKLASGAAATASTLWAAAMAAWGRPLHRARDGTTALLLGALAAGLVGLQGTALVPLALGLAALAWLDVRTGLLPDALTLPLMGAGWVLGLQDIGAAVGASGLIWMLLAALAWCYRRLRGHDGFGGGDVKCLAAVAGWVGLDAAAAILWLACVLGVVACVCRSGAWQRPYAFGPCIAAAAWCWMLMLHSQGSPLIGFSHILAVQSWF